MYNILEPGDSVMADKGFDIEVDLKNIGCSLTIPPFLEAHSQFTEQQLEQTRNIAAVQSMLRELF